MRIVIATQEDPFYLPPALDALCRAWGADVAGIVLLPAFNEGLRDTAARLYEFYGPVDFVRLGLRFAGARLADALNAVVPLTRPYSARDVARRHRIPVYTPTKINAPEFVATLRDEVRPDLLVSVAASQILRRQVLAVPRHGCINLHSAPLPRYQGMMPNFWTMVHGEPEATVTVHYMVERLDAGDIILQRPVPILPRDSLHDLMVRSKEIGVQALLDAVAQIEHGAVRARPMDASQATYFSFPKRADAERLRRMGRSLL
ncbi:MAG TPA: formyltransferase family protein [Solirubrobacteraceae bacterium]